jgi:putative SOS response-associated peptidase YedK
VCGRFAFYSPREAVKALFGTPLPSAPGGDDAPRYNLAPTQLIPVIRGGPAGDATGDWLRWGLVPSWARDVTIGNRLINARVETVAEKPAFRAAFRQRRCVVLASGFYEWRARPAGKQPYFMAPAPGTELPAPILAFAALWERHGAGDALLETATIITTSATGPAAEVHDRMPLTVPAELLPLWLAGPASEALTAVLAAPTPVLTAVPVSKAMNNPRSDGPELVIPIATG